MEQTNKVRKLRKGVTLVEIVAVIALIAIISLVAINAFRNVNEGARVATLDVSFEALVTAVRLFQAGNGGALPQGDIDAVLLQLAPFMEGATTAADVRNLIERTGGAANTVELNMPTISDTTLTITAVMEGLQGTYNNRQGDFDPTGGILPGGSYTRTATLSAA